MVFSPRGISIHVLVCHGNEDFRTVVMFEREISIFIGECSATGWLRDKNVEMCFQLLNEALS